MKNVIEFPDHSVIEREALDWLMKLDGDQDPSPEDLAALKEWMARSPAHTAEMESLGAFYDELIVLAELNIPMVKPTQRAKSDERSWLFGRPGAIAAGVLGLALLLQQVLLPGWLDGDRLRSSNGHYATAIGKQATIPLGDGSTVHLNTNSQISVDYSEGFRNIHLIQGEAHFDVAKNQQQPFRVYAGEGRVQAVGTAFTVYLHKDDIEVLVTEGKVELAAQTAKTPQTPAAEPQGDTQAEVPLSDAIAAAAQGSEYYVAVPVERLGLLTEGQGAVIQVTQRSDPEGAQQSGALKPMAEGTLKRREAWRKGLVLFAGDTLEEVVAEISRYTTVSIEIIDPELKKIRIGGQFRVGDISGMFDVLEANFGLKITLLADDRVQISAAKNSQAE